MFEHRSEENLTRYIYVQNPDALETVSACQFQDQRLARYISELEATLETLRSLRAQNFSRMQYLYSLTWSPVVELSREKRYDGKVKYYLTVSRIYSDPSVPPEQISCQTYPGAQRHQAIADFKAYVKSHPGILHEMHIEKSKWER